MAQSDRAELGAFLRDSTGVPRTYFNPDASVRLTYPCIVYQRDRVDPEYADNGVYRLSYRYTLTLIDRDPDSEFVEKIALLPRCRHSRHYVADNLCHDVFTIYYK